MRRFSSNSAGHRRGPVVCGAALWLATVLWAAPAGSQTAGFELNFSNPGARSMGFGGAFVALADDATAAFANPAGLTQLVDPEISFEGRSEDYSTPYFSGGRFGGLPTGIGVDTEVGVRTDRSRAELAGLSFISFVYPRKRWSIAVYRHRLADLDFAGGTQGIFGGLERAADIRTAIDLELVNQSIAVAYEVHEKLSLGLGLSLFEGAMRQVQDQYLANDTPESPYGHNSYLPELRTDGVSTVIDDEDWRLTAGFLWHFSQRWSLGGSYRPGPRLEADFVIDWGPAGRGVPGPVANGSYPLAFPDVFGMGLAFRSRGGRWTASLEWDFVEYSSITESIKAGVERHSETTTVGAASDDALEIHLGAEYVFTESRIPLAVRWGVWLDPNHAVSPGTTDGGRIVVGSDEIHAAVGFGASFRRFQVDLGADLSDLRDTVSLSAIYSF